MPDAVVLTFEIFWQWLQGHANCIVSAGTPESVIYDHDDFHWHFIREEEEMLLVQIIRGKELVGEILIDPRNVTHVQQLERDKEEFLFECHMSSPEGSIPAYYFTLSHAYTPEEQDRRKRWVH